MKLNRTQLFLATLDKEKEVAELKLFKTFMEMFDEKTDIDLIFAENSNLKWTDFTHLIDLYVTKD